LAQTNQTRSSHDASQNVEQTRRPWPHSHNHKNQTHEEMNREIKFRAYVPSLRKFLILTLINDDAEVWYEGQEGDKKVIGSELPKHEGWKQFIDLKDKNGKEIYDGDIVKAIFDEAIEDMPEQSTLHTVEWGIEHSYPAFDLIPLKGDDERVSDEVNGFSYCLESGIDLEVIGNIYENPELLK
jgi:uncharacterized phage protein (TIGR01671 family)